MSRQDGILRLKSLRERNELTGEQMAEERGRFAALAGRHENGTAPRAVSAFNLFQTPEEIAKEMAAILIKQLAPYKTQRILEPSAGLGRLLKALPADWETVAVEQSPTIAGELYRLTESMPSTRLVQGDFLEMNTERLGGQFDGVIMNPPFKQGRDIKHIKHAYEMLTPGGLLVALCFDGVKQNKQLAPIVDSWEPLPPDSFKSEGTKANAVMLTWGKE